MQYDNL
ncbi:e9449421-925e-4cb9-a5f3-f5acc6425b69 [Thermothielavioides terrestris]|nr:e9449421-925e-4cb9-a5f3-f5acc6425b69 [Thermothielavioides terrestris]